MKINLNGSSAGDVRWWRCVVLVVAGWVVGSQLAVSGQTEKSRMTLSLDECVRMALTGNLELQIESVTPRVAALSLDASYGYYDPVLMAQVRRENASDTGGFDPADFSRDAIYSAESTVSSSSVVGVLPTGLSYSLDGNYANSLGERNGLNFDSHRMGLGVTLRQPLLKNAWVDSGRLAIRLNKHQVTWSRAGLELAASRVVHEVELAYAELQAAHEQVKILESIHETRNRWGKVVRRQLDQGLATVSDEALARSRVAANETTRIEAEHALAMAGIRLAHVLGAGFRERAQAMLVPGEALLTMPVGLELQESWKRGVARRGEVMQAREQTAMAEVQKRFRRNQLFPALDVVGSYSRKGASAVQLPPPFVPDAAAGDAWRQVTSAAAPSDWIGAVFTVPLSRQAERAQYRISKELLNQSRLRAQLVEQTVLREIADAVHAVDSGYRRVRSAQRALEIAEVTLDSEVKRVEGGLSDWVLVYQLQDDLLNARTLEVRSRAEYNQALSALLFAEGTLLEARKIEF